MAEILDFKILFQNLICCLSRSLDRHDQAFGYVILITETSYHGKS